MKDVQCYELFGGIALKNHTFSFHFFHYTGGSQSRQSGGSHCNHTGVIHYHHMSRKLSHLTGGSQFHHTGGKQFIPIGA